MKGPAFWGFLGFAVVTVGLALGGGFWALASGGGAMTQAFSSLLIFMGVSLALMVGSLILIWKKQEKKGT